MGVFKPSSRLHARSESRVILCAVIGSDLSGTVCLAVPLYMALGLACASTVQHTNSVELGSRPGVALRVQSWIVSFYSPCAAPRAYTSGHGGPMSAIVDRSRKIRYLYIRLYCMLVYGLRFTD